MLDIKEKIIRWQHEDTGRLVDIPIGKNPGHRWYPIPKLKKEQVKQMNKAGQVFKKAMVVLAERILETTNAMKKFSDAVGRIKMDKQLKKVPRISCKIKEDK